LSRLKPKVLAVAGRFVAYAPPPVESVPSRLTRYPVIGDPPVDDGGSQLTVALVGSASPIAARDAGCVGSRLGGGDVGGAGVVGLGDAVGVGVGVVPAEVTPIVGPPAIAFSA
jgi:hypothetical protein